MKKKQAFILLMLLALVTALLAACGEEATPKPASSGTTAASSGGSTTGGDANAVIKNSVGALAGVKDYQATLDMTFTGAGAGNITIDVVLKGSPAGADEGGKGVPQFKGTVTKSSIPLLASGTVAVLGKDTFLYDPTSKVVLKGGSGSASSELYNVFIGGQTKTATLYSSDLATPTLAGDEKVGSYDTTRLTFAPKSGLEGTSAFGKGAKGTIWIDKASNLPVQLEYSEEGASMKWTVSNLQVNKGVDDAKLSFTPPADAKVVDATQFSKTTTVASLDEAKAKAGFAFPTVSYLPSDLPKDPTSVGVQTTPLGSIVTADYTVKAAATGVTPFPNAKGKDPAQTSKGIFVRAFKSAVNLPSNLPSGATVSDVTVNGAKGTLAVLNDKVAILTFQKGDLWITVNTSDYGKDEVQKVAEGLK